MTWVSRKADKAPDHACEPPMREVTYTFPSASLNPDARPTPDSFETPAGHLGDLWRCDECAALWRIGRACDVCEAYGPDQHRSGQCRVGMAWRPASWWQRWRHRG